MQRHIIHRQKITMQVARQEDAHGLQNMVSNLLQNELPAKIETVIAGLFPSDKITRIDSLRLNLGNIDPQNFEQGFKSQFIEEFKKALASKKENLSEANNEEQLSNKQSLLDSLIYFIENGSLPWYRTVKNIAAWETEILQNFSSYEYQYLVEWLLHNHSSNPVVLRRMVMQFSDRFLEKLILEIAPHQINQCQNIYHDLSAILEVCLRRKQSFKDEIWKNVFHVLLNNIGQHPDDEDNNIWVFHVLKVLAGQFNINRGDITSVMEIRLNKKLKTDVVKGSFKSLVAFLESREQESPIKTNYVKTGAVKTNLVKTGPVKTGIDETNSVKTGAVDKGKTALPQKAILDIKADKNENLSGTKIKKLSVSAEDALFINGSGAVILHFFLKPYFEDLKLVVKGKFINNAAQQRAVLLLNYLVTGEVEAAEFDMGLQKILCGYPLEETLPASIVLTKKEKSESAKLLLAVTDHWAPLKNTSVDGLRASFLQRDGKITTKENGWLLTVEQKTVDILLGKLPWGFSTIRLSWMEKILNVDWY